jgi:hypothetical protein
LCMAEIETSLNDLGALRGLTSTSTKPPDFGLLTEF